MSATDEKLLDAGIRAAGDFVSATIDVIKNEIKSWQDTRKVKKEAYIKFLREQYKIPIWYMHYSFSKNILAEE